MHIQTICAKNKVVVNGTIRNKLWSVLIVSILCMLWCAPQLQASKKTFTVVIDAGHGGRDPGARGRKTNEKNINLAIAKRLGEMIADGHKDVKVIYTRTSDKFVGLETRANIANHNNANLFISIHTNSLKHGSSVRGTETYTLGLAQTKENLDVAMLENSAILLEDNYKKRYENFNPNSSESYIMFDLIQNKNMAQSIALATEIQRGFEQAGRKNRGVRQAGFLVLKATSMPSVLVEVGYISNPDEESYMASDKGRTELARAIYNAFGRYKRDYERKQGQGVSRKEAPEKKKEEPKSSPTSRSSSSSRSSVSVQFDGPARSVVGESRHSSTSSSGVVYKVQILTSDKPLPDNARAFKGRRTSYYREGGKYKYTCGETTEFKDIQRLHRELQKDFPNAFIIRMKDGKRLK